MNLKYIYNDHINTDMTFARFKSICQECWNDCKCGFIVIDKDSEINNGHYRKHFDKFLINRTDIK